MKDVTPRTVRFWHRVNDCWTRIALRDGDSLAWNYGGRTEEGFACGSYAWARDGDELRFSAWTQERDCDGLTSFEWDCTCPIAERGSGYPIPAGDDASDVGPNWQVERQGQRDHEAEKAGY